jgi:hypothetical protein
MKSNIGSQTKQMTIAYKSLCLGLTIRSTKKSNNEPKNYCWVVLDGACGMEKFIEVDLKCR